MTREDQFDTALLEQAEDGQRNKYLTFLLAEEYYGMEISYVTEIIGIQKVTEVPRMPSYIKGVINLRGQVIPVMDVRMRFNLPELAYNDRTCIIVVNTGLIVVGLVVDEVSEVLVIPDNRIEKVNRGDQGVASRCIRGMAKLDSGVKILLNLKELVFSGEEGRLGERMVQEAFEE